MVVLLFSDSIPIFTKQDFRPRILIIQEKLERQKALKVIFLSQFPMKSPVCNNLPCSQTLFYHFAFVCLFC